MNKEELDQIIEKSFSTEPEYRLPADFAQRLSLKITHRVQWIANLYEYLLISAIVVFLIAATCGTYYVVDQQLFKKIVQFVSGNALPIAMFVFVLNFILFADRVLLRLLFRRWS